MAQKNSLDNLMMTFADLSASNKGKSKLIIGLLMNVLQDEPDVLNYQLIYLTLLDLGC